MSEYNNERLIKLETELTKFKKEYEKLAPFYTRDGMQALMKKYWPDVVEKQERIETEFNTLISVVALARERAEQAEARVLRLEKECRMTYDILTESVLHETNRAEKAERNAARRLKLLQEVRDKWIEDADPRELTGLLADLDAELGISLMAGGLEE